MVWRERWSVLLRVLVFFLLSYAGLRIFAMALYPLFGLLIASVVGAFAAAAIANTLALRMYEGGRLPDIGLHWTTVSPRHLGIGVAVGLGAGLLVVGLPLLTGAARWIPAGEPNGGLPTFVFVSLILLFGAVGEEMLFRGFGFQTLVRTLGPAATILPTSVLFAAAHSDNQSVTPLGLFNTFAWGCVLGWAVLRSGDLWMPIGLHFGWNWMLTLLGVNLSGFTMRVTGVALEWNISDLWSGGAYGPEGGLLCTLVLAPVVVALLRAPIQEQQLPLTRSAQERA